MGVKWKSAAISKDALHRIKREAVVQEAGFCFRRKGYHNTSLDEVASALSITKAALYNYVKDKEEILFECHRIGLDLGEVALAEALRMEGPARGRLHAFVERYVALLTTERGGAGMLTEIDALTAAHRAEIVGRRDDFEARLADLLREGAADGSLRGVDPKLAVFAFMGTINWIPRWFMPGGRLDGATVAREIAAMILGGLAEPRSPTSDATVTSPGGADAGLSEELVDDPPAVHPRTAQLRSERRGRSRPAAKV